MTDSSGKVYRFDPIDPSKFDLLRIDSAPWLDGSTCVFRVNSRGHVLQHGLPLWAWFLITGCSSSLVTLGAVWAIWG